VQGETVRKDEPRTGETCEISIQVTSIRVGKQRWRLFWPMFLRLKAVVASFALHNDATLKHGWTRSATLGGQTNLETS